MLSIEEFLSRRARTLLKRYKYLIYFHYRFSSFGKLEIKFLFGKFRSENQFTERTTTDNFLIIIFLRYPLIIASLLLIFCSL